MPSSLTIVLPIALVYSTRPPVSVLVRAPEALSQKFFLEAWNHRLHALASSSHLGLELGGFAYPEAYLLSRGRPEPRPAILLRYSIDQMCNRRYRNVYLLCIDYASRPRLSSRLTLGGLALPRKPWTYGGDVFHITLVTHASIRTSGRSTDGCPLCFDAYGTLPYHCYNSPLLRYHA
jgi:hypothetical protein